MPVIANEVTRRAARANQSSDLSLVKAYWIAASALGLLAMTVPPKAEVFCLGEKTFSFEIADTPEKRASGLMHRTTLGNYDGMIFTFDPPRAVKMWMKDTPLSLDMLFIDANGQVVHTVKNTTPYSTDIIESRHKVTHVIELEAGRADKEEITEGSKLLRGNCPVVQR